MVNGLSNRPLVPHNATSRWGLALGLLTLVAFSLGCPPEPNGDGFGVPMTREQHEPLFPIVDGAHGGMDCAACHGGSPSFNDFTCMSCHDHNEEDTNTQHRAVPSYMYEAVACYQCHPRGEAGPPGGHELLFPIDPPAVHADIGCSECHLALEPNQYGRNNCAGCHYALDDHDIDALHGDVGEFDDEGRVIESADCKSCHAESQVDAIADHGPFLIQGPMGQPVPHEKSNCMECHVDGRADKAWATDFAQQSCALCHTQPDMDPVHAPVVGYAYDTPTCLTCHPDGYKITYIEHEANFPIEPPAAHQEIGCGDCHILGEEPSVTRCRECHELEEGDDLPGIHLDVGEFNGHAAEFQDSVQCKRCHAESQVDRVGDHGPFLIAPDEPHNRENCLDCHTDARPDKEWAADFSQKSCEYCHLQPDMTDTHDGIFGYAYETTTCLTCHPDGRKVTDVAHEQYFPIAPGAEHDEIGCAECHLDSADASQNACRQCHETEDDLPAIHAQVGEFQDGGFDAQDSTQCKRCHAESQVDAITDHGPFLIQPGSEHNKENCLECHTQSRADKDWAADFEQRSCFFCHGATETNADHSGVFGYAYETNTCLSCHPDGSKDVNLDHTPFFPIAPGSEHEGVDCSSCHTSNTDPSQNACRTCHEVERNEDLAGIHNDVGEFSDGGATLTSTDCKTCHAESQVDAVSAHGPFLITPGNEHHRENCLDCHRAKRTDKDWAADFEQRTCLFCHQPNETNADHNGIAGYAYTDNACLTCHPDGSKDVTIDHEPFFPLALPAVHNEVGCSECHLSSTDQSVVGCQECHNGPQGDDLPGIHINVGEWLNAPAAQDSGQCKRCHADSQVDSVALHGPFNIEPDAPHHGQECLECHTSWRTDKPWAADFADQSCTGCHLQGETTPFHNGIPGYQYNTQVCLSCHVDGSRDVDIFHEDFFPLEPPAAHADITCGDCHLSDTDRSVVACRECHETTVGDNLPAIHGDVGEFVNDPALQDSNQCKRCHAESQVDPVAAHGLFLITPTPANEHYQQNCLECHSSSRADKPWATDFTEKSCFACHAQTPTGQIHNGIAGYAYDTNTCLSCHPDGTGAVTIDHEAYFPLAPPAVHNGIGCDDCHLSTTNRAQVACRECHEGTEMQNLNAIHSDVGEFANNPGAQNSTQCKRCHAESQVDEVADHGPFLITNGNNHFRENCLECHAQSRPDKAWATDFNQRSCSNCHAQNEMNQVHNGFAGYVYETQTCLSCHPDGNAAVNIDHTPIFPIAQGDAHEDVTCGECHLNSNDWTQNGCRQCHEGTMGESISNMHSLVGAPSGGWGSADSNDCKMCHGDAQTDDPTQHLPFRITSGKHNRKNCQRCHEQVRAAPKDFATNFDEDLISCQQCHSVNKMNDKHSGRPGYISGNYPNCLNCHPNGN